MVLPSLVTLVYFIWMDGSAAGLQQVAYAVMKSLQFGLPVAWVALVARKVPRLPFRPTHGLTESLLFGCLALAVTVAGYNFVFEPMGQFDSASEVIRAKLVGLGLGSFWRFAAFALFCSTVHAFLEEYYWRWFVYGRLAGLVRFRWAVVVSALSFAAHHVILLAHYFGWGSPLTWLLASAVAIGGAFWAWMYQRTGSLLGPWLSHVLADVGIFVVGYQICRSAF